MKVAVVCPYAFDAHGGVQDQVARIVGWLRDSGHRAWAVAPGSGGPEGTRHVGRFISVRANRSRAPIALGPMVVNKVAAAVDDADVVHIHEPFMPLVSLGALLAKTPPKVGTFHADPGRIARGFYRGASWILHRMALRLAATTVVSRVAADALGSVVKPDIVPNGIDLDAYSADAERVSGRVLFIGRDDPRKGLDVLLNAWPGIREQRPDASLHLIGVERTGALWRRFGEVASAHYLGRVSEERKLAELGKAEVLVAPNRGGESFGIVVLEGLASGCAVVATDLAAFRLVAGDAAVYFDIGDSDGLAREILATISSTDRLAAMTAAGREASQHFGRDKVLGGYLVAYESACSGA